MNKNTVIFINVLILLSLFDKVSSQDFQSEITSYHTIEANNEEWKSITVTASAYNSIESQTGLNPNITAFGDSLKPGMKCIAVSSDLLKAGIKQNTRVKIKGLEGEYIVNDKMHSRWTNHIDIYMGTDVNAAKQWGRKKVRIKYYTP